MAFRPISTLVALGVVMAATLSLTPSAAQTVTFADSNLDAAVRQAISKSSGPIDVSDLQGLTELQATDCQIVDLSGIQFCTDLERLWLGGNQIVGLQPLSGLTGLRHLYLWDNRISSLEPLSELVNLTVLDLAYNRISALQPLTSLHSLVELGLEHNTISDVQPLAALIGLQMLGLNFNAITNLQPLSGLTNLSYLSVWSNQVADLQPISGLSGLTFLDISANSIIDLQPLASLQALQYLYAMDNYITDPSPLTWLHNLSQVDLAHNMLTDLTALVSNPGLSTDDIVILNENWLVLGEDTQAGIAIQTLRDRGVKVWCDNQLAPQPPPAPIALMATIDVTGHVALNWTDTSIGEQGFQLQRRIRNADGTWPQLWTVIATLPADSQHHLDNSLTNKGTYQYRVQSFNIVGSSYWATSQGLTVTPPHTCRTKPYCRMGGGRGYGAHCHMARQLQQRD
jgi:Leucine-rich repeat (LRR) protein